jgi:polyribonucleotide nucleotidyltransferase
MKFDVISREINWAGRTLRLETGKVARQADGAVMVSYGDTVVLCTVVANKNTAAKNDFFPLTVHYTEKTFSAGRIPGGFFKREGRPSEKEVLTSRLIDRPIRPLFESWYNQDTQVLCTVLSWMLTLPRWWGLRLPWPFLGFLLSPPLPPPVWGMLTMRSC